MKKHVLFGILGVSLIVAIAIAFLMAAPKPVQYTWKAVILDSSANLTGGTGGSHDSNYPGWVYKDSDEFANVNVFIRTFLQRGTKNYASVFNLDVYTPSQVAFQDVLLPFYGEDGTLNGCGFPNTTELSMPSCFETFLNQPHPASDYRRISLTHQSLCCATQEEADFTKMAIGDRRGMSLYGFIEGQNLYGDCADCGNYNYHCLYLKARGWEKTSGNWDIYLEREGDDVWKLVVCTQFDNPQFLQSYPGPFDSGADDIFEEYCECVPGKNKKVLTHNVLIPAWGRGLVAYEILFIRSQQ